MKTWAEVLANTIHIGEFDAEVENHRDLEIRYSPKEKRFYTQVKTDIISAPSQRALEKRIKTILQTEWTKAIQVSYRGRVTTPKLVKAVRRGSRFYILDEEGKLKLADSYFLYNYSDETWNELCRLNEEHRKLQEEEELLESQWRKAVDKAGQLKYESV